MIFFDIAELSIPYSIPSEYPSEYALYHLRYELSSLLELLALLISSAISEFDKLYLSLLRKKRLGCELYRPPKVRPKNLTIGGRYFYG